MNFKVFFSLHNKRGLRKSIDRYLVAWIQKTKLLIINGNLNLENDSAAETRDRPRNL